MSCFTETPGGDDPDVSRQPWLSASRPTHRSARRPSGRCRCSTPRPASFRGPPAPEDLHRRQPEGRRREDDDGGEPRAALAVQGLKTLVIDLDPQGNASTALGIADRHSGTPSSYEVLLGEIPLQAAIRQSPHSDRLFCVPATIDLAGAEIELVSMVARENRLRNALAELDESDFDYVFIDCPPSLGLLTINALVAAPEVLIPIQCEYYALEGVSQLMKNIEMVKAHLNPRLTCQHRAPHHVRRPD